MRKLAVYVLSGVAVLAVAATAEERDDGVYEPFSRFCAASFSAAAEPEACRAFGKELTLLPAGAWMHVSERSAAIACQTNLPARAFVEYGPTAGYGRATERDERATSLHLHTLRGLEAGRAVHWRWVAVDEAGHRLAGPDAVLRTPKLTDAVRVPGDLPGPPYVLDKAGATYVLTEDITAAGTGVFVAASGITLDLGGHTVTYDTKRDEASRGACGVRGHKTRGIGLSRVRVVNGTIRRGRGGSATQKVWETLYEPLFFSKPQRLEIAGVRVHYHGCQVVGLLWINGGRDANVHHNVFLDEGTRLFNRHVGMDAIAPLAPGAKVTRNLVLRTRHRGVHAVGGADVTGNEVYVDSYATNSYGIMYYAGRAGAEGVRIGHNRVFGAGYHPVGIGSGQGYRDVVIHDNYIQMQGVDDQQRWKGGQGGGDAPTQLHPVNGVRLQAPRGRIEHRDNVIVVKGRGATCWMRGLWIVAGREKAEGLIFRGNRVKVISQDGKADGYGVSAGGAGEESRSTTVCLTGNTVLSNVRHVQFGDNYSHGGRYDLEDNTFVKLGRDPRYRTIRFGWHGWRYGSWGHVFTDTVFQDGAGFDSISFDGAAGGRYDFAVRWTLKLRTAPGAAVIVRDREGREAFSGTVGREGSVAIPLTQYVRSQRAREDRTPHTVTVTRGGATSVRKVAIDGPKEIDARTWK